MGEWLPIGQTGHRAYLATPASDRGPGVLVLHAWWGLTPVFTEICDRLAAAGFMALAPELYPGGATAETIPEAETLRDAHEETADEVRALLRAVVARLQALPAVSGDRIGVIGFSLGAYWALWLSQVQPDEVGAVVTVYGTDDGDYEAAHAAYLGHFAEQDAFEAAGGSPRPGRAHPRGGARGDVPYLPRRQPLVRRAEPPRV